MGKKRLTLAELRERRADIDQAILQVRKLFDTHKAEREKIYSPENKRLMTTVGLQQKEQELRRKTEPLLASQNASIAKHASEAVEHRDMWSYEHELRASRFAPESNGTPLTEAAQNRALFHELMETFKRGNTENRAARFTTADLIAETERAATSGEVAALAVYRQEVRNRQLKGEEKLHFDMAFKKLTLPEIDEAQVVYKDLEDLSQEADGLFTLWKEPGNQTAQSYESLGRFNRRKRNERFVKLIEERVSEADAFRLQWQHGQAQEFKEQQQQAASAPEQSSAA